MERPAANVLVEEARPDDARDLLTLHYEVLGESRWFITEPQEFSPSLEQRVRQVRDFARSPNSLYLVARSGGRLLGYLTLQGGALRRMRHTAKLEILVSGRARGTGIGSSLLARGVQWATANPQLVKIGLNVFADNRRALALYRKFGFEEEGRRPREYRMADGTFRDDVLMYRFVED